MGKLLLTIVSGTASIWIGTSVSNVVTQCFDRVNAAMQVMP